MNKYYITTPIYYINDVPHIGHAYTTVAADVLARYHRAKGEEVFFLTGTDEHGAKIAEAAKKAGKEPKEFVDGLVPVFKNAWKKLNISYSEYFRTTDPEHEKIVQEFVGKLADKGLIEKREYEGLYCVGCEKYLRPDELIDGKCPDHGTEPVKQSEENYFFKLSQFGDRILEKINLLELEIGPDSRKNEVIGKINQGLEDISISRSGVEWGIKFPGDESQTIYVWVDALLNYYTATKIFKKEEFWPADLHLMAKDILWFHAIIWPAMLMALDLPLPKKVFAHGFFTVGNKKMSKSLGNVLDPIALVDKYSADAVRYAVLREFPFGEDGDISEEKIANRYEKDLANGLGNLLNRTLNMINKYEIKPDRKMAYFDELEDVESEELPQAELLLDTHLPNLKFDQALSDIWKLIHEKNVFIDEKKPWELAKNGEKVELERVLNAVYWQMFEIAKLLIPFMPETSERIKLQLESLKPEVLFPRLEK